MINLNYLLGADAPPYIVITISITLIATLVTLIHQYKTTGVDMYEVKFGFFKLCSIIKFLMILVYFLLGLCLLNVMLAFEGDVKKFFQILIKLVLAVSAFSYLLLGFEYYIRFKEELIAKK